MYPEGKSGASDQMVRIINGAENILDFYISRANLLRRGAEVCYDYNGPIRIRETAPIWRTNLKLDKKGIKIRFLTDIRNENIEHCKKILEEIKKLRCVIWTVLRVILLFMITRTFSYHSL